MGLRADPAGAAAASGSSRAYSNFTFDRSIVGFGDFGFMASSVSAMISETARLRNHLWLAGNTNQGAHSVLHLRIASS